MATLDINEANITYKLVEDTAYKITTLHSFTIGDFIWFNKATNKWELATDSNCDLMVLSVDCCGYWFIAASQGDFTLKSNAGFIGQAYLDSNGKITNTVGKKSIGFVHNNHFYLLISNGGGSSSGSGSDIFERGTGSLSIQSKVVDPIDANTTGGVNAFTVGAKNTNNGRYSTILGRDSIISSGWDNISIGSGNKILNNNAANGFGVDSVVSVFTFGQNNTIDSQGDNYVFGDNNEINVKISNYSLIVGSNNKILKGNNDNCNVFILGGSNTVTDSYGSLVTGYGNTVKSSSNSIFAGGGNNTIEGGYQSIVAAAYSTLLAGQCVLIGSNNIIGKYSSNSIVVGSSNVLESGASASMAVGYGNHVYSTGAESFLFGISNLSTAYYTLAVGSNNQVTGNYSLAFGFNSLASGETSFAFGSSPQGHTLASGKSSFAFGNYEYELISGNYTLFDAPKATADYSFAFGTDVTVSAKNSFGFGKSILIKNNSSGPPSVFAFGEKITSDLSGYSAIFGYGHSCGNGMFSIISGNRNTNNADMSAVFGDGNVNNGFGAVLCGGYNVNNAYFSNLFGSNNTNSSNAFGSTVMGQYNTNDSLHSLIAGSSNTSTGLFNYTFGQSNTNSSSEHSTIFGEDNVIASTAFRSFISGQGNTFSNGYYLYAFGRDNTISNGQFVFAIGESNTITANRTLTLGDRNVVTGTGYSIISGSNNNLLGSAKFSIISGDYNTVSGIYSQAHGTNVNVSGIFSYVFGQGNVVSDNEQFVIGKYAVTDVNSNKLLKIGYGSSDSDRKDVFYVTNTGSTFTNRLKISDIQKYAPSASLKHVVIDESTNELKTAGVTISSSAPTDVPGEGEFIWYVV